MPTPPNLPLSTTDLESRALEAINAEFGAYLARLAQTAGDAHTRLAQVTADLVGYWRLRAEGKDREAEGLLEVLRATAALIAGGAALSATTDSRLAAQRTIELLARLGSILLKGLLS